MCPSFALFLTCCKTERCPYLVPGILETSSGSWPHSAVLGLFHFVCLEATRECTQGFLPVSPALTTELKPLPCPWCDRGAAHCFYRTLATRFHLQVAQLFTDNFDYQTRDDFVRGLLVNEEVRKSLCRRLGWACL